ncbi:hypothetical protein ZTR_10436 [Talaromyces verruculosus]|nr:hypothetical protein ZTR_10436 [Talaromyces verruculosus]
MATLFSQWSGAHAITQDSPSIFGYLGIKGTESTFLATGIYAIAKFDSTMLFGIFVVDFISRRRSLMAGICLQITTLAFVGAYLGVTKDMAADHINDIPSASRASTAAIVTIYLHAVAWSIGWCSIPYILGPEIFPIWIQSLNVSILMAIHWLFYFASSRATPSLFAATDKWGASYVLWFSLHGFACDVFFAMPDTIGRSIKALDSLFQRPWYTAWRMAYPTSGERQEMTDDPKSTAESCREVILANVIQEPV